MKPVNFEFEYENFTYEVTHNGYDLDGFVLEWDGYVQCIDTPDENKCDLRPVYIESTITKSVFSALSSFRGKLTF